MKLQKKLQKSSKEFHNLKNIIESKGIKVTAMKGSKDCPDHIFPNWFITFSNKTMQIFSMLAPNRRIEKKPHMIEHLSKTYQLTDDMSHLEEKEIFLNQPAVWFLIELIDVFMLVYLQGQMQFNLYCGVKKIDFELVLFETESHTGSAIYHTDVMMFVGTEIIGICFDVIKSEYRDFVKEKVNRYHKILELSSNQILNFCGNAIEAKNSENELF